MKLQYLQDNYKKICIRLYFNNVIITGSKDWDEQRYSCDVSQNGCTCAHNEGNHDELQWYGSSSFW